MLGSGGRRKGRQGTQTVTDMAFPISLEDGDLKVKIRFMGMGFLVYLSFSWAL